jgi:hypothetical protein
VAAISATLSPASLSFGFMTLKKANVKPTLDLKITNVTEVSDKFVITAEPSDAGDGVHITAKVRSVGLEPGQTATVKIKLIAEGRVAQRRDYVGYIVVADRNGQVLRAPYWVRVVKKHCYKYRCCSRCSCP